MKNYQICNNCVMDTTDPNIEFDNDGICNNCKEAVELGEFVWFPNIEGEKKLHSIINKIKKDGKNKEYDAIVGLSGGVDSSYLVYKAATEWKLRLLVVHVDAGWNNDIAINNVKAVCDFNNVELKIIKVDFEEIKKLQLAFLRAAVPNQDIPQDHAFFSTLYGYAAQSKIKYVLSGSNWETENILPKSWSHSSFDGKHIKNIYKKYGEGKLKNYPLSSIYKLKVYYPYIRKIKTIKPLNYIEYNKEKAMQELIENTNWRYYGGKHYESIWTKFFQSYYLPVKFNIDKRKAHLSSLIVSGQITREKALKELEQQPYDKRNIKLEKENISKKLGISVDELDMFIKSENKKHSDYKCTTNSLLYKILSRSYQVRRRYIK